MSTPTRVGIDGTSLQRHYAANVAAAQATPADAVLKSAGFGDNKIIALTGRRGLWLQPIAVGAVAETFKVDLVGLVSHVDPDNPETAAWLTHPLGSLAGTITAATGIAGGVVEAGESFASLVWTANNLMTDIERAMGTTGLVLRGQVASAVDAQSLMLPDLGNIQAVLPIITAIGGGGQASAVNLLVTPHS